MPSSNYIPRISILSGIVMPGDALSETVIADLEAVDELAAASRRNLDVKVFCADSAHADARVNLVQHWPDLIQDPHFRSSDIYIYHFGVFNPIHHSMAFTRRDAHVSVFFHNITPPQYLPRVAEELTKDSYQQIEAFRSADLLMAASKYSASQLAGYDLGKPIEVVPLFGRNASAPVARAAWHAPNPVKLIYCGRFVASKGVDTLLAALAQVEVSSDQPIELLMVGLTEFSDKDYITRLRGMTRGMQAGVSARFAFDLSASELRQHIASSDMLVLPSLHEGFGMPVIEALAAGVPVVCSRSGAIPEVADGLALSFAAGDPGDLANCLRRAFSACREFAVASDLGECPYPDWLAKAQAHCERFSRQRYVKSSSERFGRLLQGLGHESNSFRNYLQNIGRQAFGATEQVNGLDAALAALLSAAEIKGPLIGDVEGTLGRLLRWPFERQQSESDLAHWREIMVDRGQRGLLRQLAGCSEVRDSAPRRQAAVYLQAALSEQIDTFEFAAKPHVEPLTLQHPTVQLILAGDTQDAEFVRQAYSLLLGREAEHGGLGAYFEGLQRGTLSRRDVLTEIMGSAEFKLRFSAAEA